MQTHRVRMYWFSTAMLEECYRFEERVLIQGWVGLGQNTIRQWKGCTSAPGGM